MDTDSLDPPPRRQPPKPQDLTPLGIAELKAYIADLQAEIARATAEMEKKERYKAGAEALFRTPSADA